MHVDVLASTQAFLYCLEQNVEKHRIAWILSYLIIQSKCEIYI